MEIERLRYKYPNRIPLIIYQTPNFIKSYRLKKNKYLVTTEMTVGAFIYQLKKINDINTTDAMYLMIHNTLINSSSTFGLLYTKFEQEGVLKLTVNSESAFG